jgi:serine protease inhibitor
MKRITLLSTLFLCTLALSEAAGSDNASISTAVEANNAFGLDMYRQLAAENEGKNLFFSSYSVLSVLSMAAEGARDHTAKEMKAVMHLPEDLDTAHKGLSLLNTRYGPQRDPQKDKLNAEIEELEKERKVIAQKVILLDEQRAQYREIQRRGEIENSEQYMEWRDLYWQTRHREWDIVGKINKLLNQVDLTQITVANALWGETTYPFRQTYIDRVSKFYGSGALRSADFKGASEVERVRINAWVEEITRDRITNLLPPGSLNQYTRLVLANAIYFKGQWVKPFDKEKTQNEDFTLVSGQTVKVSMMKETMKHTRYGAFNADGSFFNTPENTSPDDNKQWYPGEGGFSIIELPYRGGKLAMVILAPNSPAGLGAIEKQLDAKNLGGWIALLKGRKVCVNVPKFTSETEYTLNATLKALGMKNAFTMPNLPGGANFMGMSDTQNQDEQFYISVLQHKAFVAVDEKGTEAAAATAAGMHLAGTWESGPFTPVFRADRPFLFLIRDVKTGCILFTGRIMKP